MISLTELDTEAPEAFALSFSDAIAFSFLCCMRDDLLNKGRASGIGASALVDWLGKEEGVLSVGVLGNDGDEKLGNPLLDACRSEPAVMERGDETGMGDKPPELAWLENECVLMDRGAGAVSVDEDNDE